jgi:hypothetical protein
MHLQDWMSYLCTLRYVKRCLHNWFQVPKTEHFAAFYFRTFQFEHFLCSLNNFVCSAYKRVLKCHKISIGCIFIRLLLVLWLCAKIHQALVMLWRLANLLQTQSNLYVARRSPERLNTHQKVWATWNKSSSTNKLVSVDINVSSQKVHFNKMKRKMVLNAAISS